MASSIGYKVVREVDGHLFSAVVSRREAIVEYKPNEWVGRRRKCGPLALFNNVPSARRFANRYVVFQVRPCDWQVWQCNYMVSAERELWHMYHVFNNFIGLPEGTVLADKVQLTELM